MSVSKRSSGLQSAPAEPHIQDTKVYLMKPTKLNSRVMTEGLCEEENSHCR